MPFPRTADWISSLLNSDELYASASPMWTATCDFREQNALDRVEPSDGCEACAQLYNVLDEFISTAEEHLRRYDVRREEEVEEVLFVAKLMKDHAKQLNAVFHKR